MMKRSIGTMALAAAFAAQLAVPTFAQPRDWHGHGGPGWNNGYHGGGDVVAGALVGLGLGALVGGAIAASTVPAYAYAPPPAVYYAPPPQAYYAPPPPVYYGQ